MKPDRDSLDEFYEYEAEDFLVYLALLITEGRTPEHSVKGRTEGPHCPPAQSSQPAPNKHECSDKLAQCLEARKTRSEVAFLWRNNIPIMVEVMLLPDCCYSEEGANTEVNDLNDPALKQDALLLERWTLEPVPRQSGDRFIEEKTLLLAIRSFVFFSQLSAWLSVSHGAVPCNILYRVSAAGEELKLHFSHSPTEHMFPVPNVSHNVALKVSVQSLPRKSSYPVLNCSIHSNLGSYEKKIIPREHSLTLPRSSQDNDQNSAPVSQHTFTKQAWSVGPEGLLHARTNVSTDLTLPVRNSKLLSTVDNRYNIGTTPSKLQCFSLTDYNYKAAPQETSVRNFKSFSLVGVPCSPQDSQTVETDPLIGTLIQERQEIIARIAQHLLQCDQTSSLINSHSVVHELSSINAKIFKNSSEDEQFLKKNKDIPPICASTLNLTLPTDNQKSNHKKAPDTPINSSRPIPEFHISPKPQARRKLILFESNEHDCNTFQSSGQSAIPLSSSENIHKLTEKRDIKQSEISARTGNQITNSSNTNDRLCTNTQLVPEDKSCTDPSHNQQKDNSKLCSTKAGYGNGQAQETTCRESRTSDHSSQLLSIENCINKDRDNIQYKESQDKAKSAHDENEDPTNCDCWTKGQRKCNGNCLRRCERLKNTEQKTVQRRHSSTWKKKTFRSLDGISTKAFNPRTGLPLLSSPVPQRKTQSGYFDLDTSLLKLKGLSTQSRHHSNGFTDKETEATNKQLSSSAPPAPCLSLLGNFEESVLNYRFEPLGVVEGFTAEVGASGIFCPTHMTLPVEVSFYSVSDDNAPSPYMGNIALETLGKRGYRIPPSGTIQVTLFNPNKTVVKMFVVKYDLSDMPANHQTFLRQRTFSVPVRRDPKGAVSENGLKTEDKTLRYLIHLRFQSSKSGKIYLHRDVKLLFSRKSMEVDSGAAYELKSYIETPINPPYSPRC